MFRRELPRNKALFMTIGLLVVCCAVLFGLQTEEGPRFVHVVLGIFGAIVFALGALIPEGALEILANWLLLLNVVVAVVAFVATI